MDYPKSVPSVGLVGGKFVDENPLTGTPGSLIPAQWGNAVTEEILHVITTAGLVPDEGVNTQLAAAISTIVGTTRPLASQVEAEAGTDNGKVMTPLRTLQAILKRLPLNAPVVGAARNLRCSITAASASAVFTADELVLKSALGGMSYVLPAFNKPVDISGIGAGKMDTGAAPVSGYVAVYAIYNPDLPLSATNPTTLGRNATSAAAPEIYGGGSMPAGYTASKLLAVLPTDAASQFKAAYWADRSAIIFDSTAVSTTAGVTLALLSIAASVPKNAVSVSGSIAASATSGSGGASMTVSGFANGLGSQSVAGYSTNPNGCTCPFRDLPIATPQTVWYTTALAGPGTGTFNMIIKGYTI